MLGPEVSGWVERTQVEAGHIWVQIHPVCAFGTTVNLFVLQFMKTYKANHSPYLPLELIAGARSSQ